MMRVTRLDGCGAVVPGSQSVVTSKGFITVSLTSNTEEGEPISIPNANGDICIEDTPAPKFKGYGVEIGLCGVDPRLVTLLTGQPVVLDANGNEVGFDVNSDVDLDSSGFALELWSGVPAEACEPGEGQSYGYFLFPFVKGGVFGDFTVENAAVNFTITGAQTKNGSSWGVGPYNVVYGAGTNEEQTITITGTPTGGTFTLTFDGETTDPIDWDASAGEVQAALEALDAFTPGDVIVTGGPFPGTAMVVEFSGDYGSEPVELMTGADSLTGGTNPAVGIVETTPGVAGTPGPLLVAVSTKNHLKVLKTTVAPPTEACGGTALGSEATGATEVEGSAATLTPSGSYAPANLVDAQQGDFVANPLTAWSTGSYVELEDGSHAYWTSTAWAAGEAP